VDLALKVRLGRIVVFACYTLLLAVYSIRTLWLTPLDKEPNTVVWFFHIVPLLMMLPGMLKNHYRSYIWLCFVLLFYFMTAVIQAFAPEYGWFPKFEVALIVLLFISAMMFSRWWQSYQHQRAEMI
jgi:uncharacterized membrane protein